MQQVSDHLCECGCGEFTLIAVRTHTRMGIRKGEPLRFVKGHSGGRGAFIGSGANPTGICQCGECGRQTPLASQTRRDRGQIRGEPVRFIHGHHARKDIDRYELGPTGCWLWTGGVTEDGYGKLMRDGRVEVAHRHFYEREHGAIPAGLELHHRCEVKGCVNPEHLQPLTPAEHRRLHAESAALTR